ncbi:MAG: hypothetical protein ACREQV_22950 [Candidatus Binatia bacterium]
MKNQLLKGIALGLFVAVTCVPVHAQTAGSDPAEPGLGEEVGYGVGSALANLFYIPAKVTYAGLGLLTGGLGFVLSAGRADVANNIIYPSIRGNYVVTPNHLKGSEPISFVGAPPLESGPRVDDAPATQTSTR